MPFIMRQTPIADVLEVLIPPTNFWCLWLLYGGVCKPLFSTYMVGVIMIRIVTKSQKYSMESIYD